MIKLLSTIFNYHYSHCYSTSTHIGMIASTIPVILFSVWFVVGVKLFIDDCQDFDWIVDNFFTYCKIFLLPLAISAFILYAFIREHFFMF